MEEHYEDKLEEFVDAIYHERPEIIALQEVNQTHLEAVVSPKELTRFCPCDDKTVIRKDNHVYHVVKKLQKRGVHYYWTYLSMKLGYNKYDEGIACLSLSPILQTNSLLISQSDNYHNWKTRKIIGICTAQNPDEWFYSVHFGWWNDVEEPFKEQWERTVSHLPKDKTIWLMGDFNSPAGIKNEGYDLIAMSNWYDSYLSAKDKDCGITVDKVIDGWKENTASTKGMRIDFIWCNTQPAVKSSNVIFNGTNRKVISDHYGVIIEKK